MKKADFLKLILVCITVFSLLVFARAFCEDDDPAVGFLCKNSDVLHYEEVILSHFLQVGTFYALQEEIISYHPIILFLERQEKSPPFKATF